MYRDERIDFEGLGRGFEEKKRKEKKMVKKRLEYAQLGWKHTFVVTRRQFHTN